MQIGGRTRSLLAALVLLLAGAAEGLAQEHSRVVVAGFVSDRDRSAPVPGARVRFLTVVGGDEDASPREAATLTSGPDGRFVTAPLAPARYTLHIQALGYRDVEHAIRVDGASPMQLRVELVPEAMALEPIVVASIRSRWLQSNGFYDRRARGIGNSFNRDEIGERAGGRATDVLRMLPGVTLVSARGVGSPAVLFRAGCRPDVVLDGLNLGTNVLIDDLISVGDLEGIEVFRGATHPVHYSNNPCGSVVLWSRDPSTVEGEPFTWRRLLVAAGIVTASFLLTR